MSKQYDITNQLAGFLDRHLLLAIIDDLVKLKVYPEADTAEAKLQVASKTNMVDYHIESFKAARPGEEVPQAVLQNRERVVASMKALEREVQPFLKHFDGPEGIELEKKLKDAGNFKLEYLKEEYGITEEVLESVYRFGKGRFEFGDYEIAGRMIGYYRNLSEKKSQDHSALWGDLAVQILNEDIDAALSNVRTLKESLDKGSVPQWQARCWLMHWGLFVFFNHAEGLGELVDLFFEERQQGGNYIQGTQFAAAMQTASPHMLRYIVAATIMCKAKRDKVLKELLKIIVQEQFNYSDPLTKFLQCLLGDCDFEGAQEQLRLCQEVLQGDYFLNSQAEDFLESARLLLFENYCRVHKVISISTVAEKLNMDSERAEVWIVNLIRQARLVARIDSEANQVIMDTQPRDVYQTVKDRTRSLPMRTMYLWRNLAAQKDSNGAQTVM